MRTNNRSAAPRLAAACFMVAALAGCAEPTTTWKPAEAQYNNRVEYVALRHNIQFAPGAVVLSGAEQKKLDGFLDRIGTRHGDRLALYPSGPDDGRTAALSTNRAAAIAQQLRQRGLEAEAAPPGAIETAPDSLRLVVGRYLVTPPPCPNWRKEAGDDPANQTAGNWGCATSRNLGLMVADPGDLVTGREVSPADGDAEARRFRDYRTGESKKAKNQAPPINVNIGGGGKAQ